jgi:hypothetical protein
MSSTAKKEQTPAKELPASEAINVSMGLKEMAKRKIEELMKEETKVVQGIFHNYETPGGSATIHVEKYKGIPAFKKSMMDGFSYEVPLYVARFLNGIDVTAGALAENRNPETQKIGTCSYAIHGFKMNDPSQPVPSQFGAGPNGEGGVPVPLVGISKRIRRYGFSSMEGFGGVS